MKADIIIEFYCMSIQLTLSRLPYNVPALPSPSCYWCVQYENRHFFTLSLIPVCLFSIWFWIL